MGMKDSGYVLLYSELFLKFGLREFSVGDVVGRFGGRFGGTPINIMLQRLYDKGYLDRVGRGVYRVVHPYVYILNRVGGGWRERIDPRYRLLVDVLVSGLVDLFMDRLVSIVLFGSLARGSVHRFSDVDLLVIADGLPKKYGLRVKMLKPILDKLTPYRIKLWRQHGIYPNIDIIILDRAEGTVNHPFYLDLVTDAVIIYDREGFIENRIRRLREKLLEIGAMKVERPDGRYYWVLKPGLRWGEVLEL